MYTGDVKKHSPWFIVIVTSIFTPLAATVVEACTPDRTNDINNWPLFLFLPFTFALTVVTFLVFLLIVRSKDKHRRGAIVITGVINSLYVISIIARLLRQYF